MQLSRSVVEMSIDRMVATCAKFGVHLPPFAFWSADVWDGYPPAVEEIRDCMLGWDVTDFSSGDYANIGRTLFTLRNGSVSKPGYPKRYAEKLLLNPEGQRAPAHYHASKMEDIRNLAGGNMLVQLTRVSPAGQPVETSFEISRDGERLPIEAGGLLRLEAGQSVCIPPFTLHQFWGEPGTGITLSAEVSSVCDDRGDNYFVNPAQRFPEILEDVPRRHYLCHEYPAPD
jgi:D-lyxose ketol-isomerase